MSMNIEESFDADAILREFDDEGIVEDENKNEDDISELELGNENRLNDLDIPDEDGVYGDDNGYYK